MNVLISLIGPPKKIRPFLLFPFTCFDWIQQLSTKAVYWIYHPLAHKNPIEQQVVVC